MPYHLFEIPSLDGHHTDVVYADPENSNAPAYSHYAFTIGASANANELMDRRGIWFSQLRPWEDLFHKFPYVREMLEQKKAYFPGGSVLNNSKDLNPTFRINTVMRLGALEILGNIFSGRITVSNKDPFPHQLALQQYMKTHQLRVKRVLIADEVGLGKTIEVGLILRDLLIAQRQIHCLYLTKGGLLDDVKQKLESLIPGMDNQSIIEVENRFVEYGKRRTDGIHIASMDAARRYVEKSDKKNLPPGIKPKIIIIDEAHHCASEDRLTNPQFIGRKRTTKAYQAAYQMITGEFWNNSNPPELVILMSATPFSSENQFINLLRLLTHRTSVIENSYSDDIYQQKLVNLLASDQSPIALIWRQQDTVRNWNNEKMFPTLTIERPNLRVSDEYLQLIKKIRRKVQEIRKNHNQRFSGFSVRQLETRLTSSTISGAIWLFRWCIKHTKWDNQTVYKQDKSDSTENLRKLIKAISQKLAVYNQSIKSEHVDVSFPSDNNFTFQARAIAQPNNTIPDIYDFSKHLHEDEEEDSNFIADNGEILELTQLALELLSFSDANGQPGVENAKLDWLKEMLNRDPESKFLIFTESLQTCEIIIKALPEYSGKLTGDMSLSQREDTVARLRGLGERGSNIRVLVATSAADEGFDFQTANRVIHWDLTPNPAVLMQRNGRVARLGQISDVIAYYLIIADTHEEKRERALVDRFTQMGIQDERMRLKILGLLSSEDEEKIFKDIEENKVSLIDDILKKAESAHNDMEKQLKEVQTEVKRQWVISRKELETRLEKWMELGLCSIDHKYNLNFSTKKWNRPVFENEGTVIKTTETKIATILNKKFTFDPEFNLFGQEKENIKLAGLCPWVKKEDGSGHIPLHDLDPIGCLARSLSRKVQADFTTISAKRFYGCFPDLQSQNIQYVLFVTHPLRELENNMTSNSYSYLTFYTFNSDLSHPLKEEGATGEEVYNLISLLEDDAITIASTALQEDILDMAKEAGEKISMWLKKSAKLPSLTEKNYFLPIPIALVSIIP